MKSNTSKHNHYYVCENCSQPLNNGDGQYFHGILLCNECRAKAQIAFENGKYDFTLAGMPTPGC